MSSELFRRYEGNPILTAAEWPYTVNAVLNPGVTRFGGETLLLVRVEDRTGLSHLCVARSADGLTNWIVEPDRRLLPEVESQPERFGIEDPRITPCGDEHMIVYTGYSDVGPLVCLAATRDFRSYERRGVVMPPEDKDAALFPCQFDGRWALIHRPVATTPGHEAHIWLSWSPRFSPLGRPHDPSPGPRGRLVGRAQGRALPAAASHSARMAPPLPRRPRHRRRLHLPARPRAP